MSTRSSRGCATVCVAATCLLLASGASALAQTPALAIGPIVQLDRLSLEGNADGSTFAAGFWVRVPVSRVVGVEAELTQAFGAFERSYEGNFILYPPAPGPVARRTVRYVPGIGGAGAVVIGRAISPRVALAGRIGVSARRVTEESTHLVLSIPSGNDPARVEADLRASDGTSVRVRGGLLMGLDVSVAVADRLSVVPTVHLVWGGPARIGDKYVEVGAGARVSWRF